MADDLQLVIGALSGDQERYNELVSKYQKLLLGLAFSYVNDYQDAQDIVQEAFMLGYRNLANLHQPHRFGAWIRQITANCAKTHLRKHQIRQLESYELLPNVNHLEEDCMEPGAIVDRKQMQRLIKLALDSLNPKYREVIVMQHMLGASVNEIATTLNVSPNTVYVRLSRGRKALQKELINVFDDDLHLLGCDAHLYLQRIIDHVRVTLANEKPHEQQQIARQLRLLAARANRERLVADLASENSNIRMEAAEIIGQTDDKGLARVLLERLAGEGEAKIQITIIQSLVALKVLEAIPVLKELERQTIHMDVLKQCSKAVERLSKVPSSSNSIVPISIADLRDAGLDQIMINMLSQNEEPASLLPLLDGLGRLRTTKPITQICELLQNSAYHQVRRQAAIALGQLGTSSNQVVDSLLKALHDESWTVVDAATIALGSFKPKERKEEIIHAHIEVFWDSLTKPFPVRYSLVEVIGTLANREGKWAELLLPKIVEELVSFPTKSEYQRFNVDYVFCKMVYALMTPGYKDLNDTIILLLKTNPRLQIVELLLALGMSKDQECIEFLSGYLSYQAPERRYMAYAKRVREAAARALMLIGDSGYRVLEETLASSSASDDAKLSVLGVWQEELSSEQIDILKDLNVTGSSRVENRWTLLLRQ